MAEINVLCILRTSSADRARIAAMDPQIKCVDAGNSMTPERALTRTWS